MYVKTYTTFSEVEGRDEAIKVSFDMHHQNFIL